MASDWDVIVIGGGLAGLAAGALATSAGQRTLVLEAHPCGGRARVVERGGFTFNHGPHALFLGGAARRVLTQLGAMPAGVAPPLDGYRLHVDGRTGALPTGPGSLLRTRALGGRDKLALARLLGTLPRLDPAALAGTTAAAWLADRGLPARAAKVAGALVRLSTYSPAELIDAGAAVAQLQSSIREGVSYLHGGWGPLIDALAARSQVQTSTQVRAVEPSAGAVEVVTDEGRLTAAHVIVATGPPDAVAALLPERPTWPGAGAPVTAACLDLGLRRVPEPGWLIDADEPLYAARQSPPARQAPAGGAVVAAIRYGARSAAVDRPQLDDLARRAGVADDDIVEQRFLARLVVAGGTPTAGAGGLAGRPRVADSGHPRLSIAGDWVGDEGLLADAALASAAAAVERVVGTPATAATGAA